MFEQMVPFLEGDKMNASAMLPSHERFKGFQESFSGYILFPQNWVLLCKYSTPYLSINLISKELQERKNL